ncbi:MAG: glycoside hydrolase family 2 protein [Clostridiales bacterium]|nr:glycoside hydrolase family 2 protein [Clostridiales bacterium]
MNSKLLQNWKFLHANPLDAWSRGYDDSHWQEVIVPHDWSVSFPFSRDNSSGTGYLPGGTGWYRTTFRLKENQKGYKVFIAFDGIYKNSQVWCNSNYLGNRPFGYASFSYDITDLVSYGEYENSIAVKVSHEDIADSRWFTGSGMYRKARILLCPPVYAPMEELFFTADPKKDSSANIQVSGLVINDTKKEAITRISASLLDNQNKEVLLMNQTYTLAPGAKEHFSLSGILSQALLWSVETPNLYTLQVQVHQEDFLHTHCLQVGIRSFRFDPDKGFFLNEKNMKIKGVCVHHDAGCLGAAVWPAVWQRRLYKLKEMGCNAIRMAHNPHMPELYDLCDKMGFLVMDESFDEWEGPKNKWSRGHNVYPPLHQGYYEDFPVWHKEDLTMMIKRDRNHPSVILWSVGNEIDYPNDPYCHPLFTEMEGNNDANKPKAERIYSENKPNMERLATIAQHLADIVREIDPTRPVLMASAFPELASQIGIFDAFDLIGYNYKEHLYHEDHLRFPTLPIIGSENGHSLENWNAVTQNDYICGQFLWTGIDYLGETPHWPMHGSSAGLLNVAGYEKPGYYRRKCLWNPTPSAYLFTTEDEEYVTKENLLTYLRRSYDFAAGQKIKVVCYTNLPEAELFQNGKSLGKKSLTNGQDAIQWHIPFERGQLKVVAGNQAETTVTDELASTLPPVAVKASVWDTPIPLAGDTGAYELRQIQLQIVDEHGLLCPTSSPLLSFEITGPGILLGIENGNLADMDDYALSQRRAYQGQAIVYVLVPTENPSASLHIFSQGFASVSVPL